MNTINFIVNAQRTQYGIIQRQTEYVKNMS
jgi:hypothetical protein